MSQKWTGLNFQANKNNTINTRSALILLSALHLFSLAVLLPHTTVNTVPKQANILCPFFLKEKILHAKRELHLL